MAQLSDQERIAALESLVAQLRTQVADLAAVVGRGAMIGPITQPPKTMEFLDAGMACFPFGSIKGAR